MSTALDNDWLTQGVILDPDRVNRSAIQVGKSIMVPHKNQVGIAKDESKFIMARAGRRFGKGLRHGTKVLRPDGAWSPIEALVEGDAVVDSTGLPVPVTGVFPRGRLPMVTVELKNGTTIDCDYEHLWSVRSRTRRHDSPPITLSVTEMLEKGVSTPTATGGTAYNFSIPVAAPAQFPERAFEVEPYACGALLGDGCLGSGGPSFSSADPEGFALLREAGLNLGEPETPRGGCQRVQVRGLLSWLNKNGLRTRGENKHLPVEYKCGSVEQRLEVLRGLMDTDGWVEGKGKRRCGFGSTAPKLTAAVQYLVESLGGKASRIYTKNTKHRDCHTVYFYMPAGSCPFRLTRKAAAWRPSQPKRLEQQIVDIRVAADGEDTCIEVASDDGLFVTEHFTLTHNTKVATKKAIRKALRDPGSVVWWVANEWKNSQRGYMEMLGQIPPGLLTKKPPLPSSRNLTLNLVGGSRIEFYTGSNPDAMAGAAVDLVIIDEAALIPHGERVWQQMIYPTLLTTKGSAIIMSTPRGRDWFWRLCQMGEKGAKDHSTYHFTSYDNPYAPREGLEQMKAGMTEMFFRQEMMAEFVANAASIFNLHHPLAVRDELVEPSGEVVLGIDLGKKEDATVISGANAETRLPCFYEKIELTRWSDQKNMIMNAVSDIEAFPGVDSARIRIDSTGAGDPMLENLEDEGLAVEGQVFSNQWKERAARLVAADLEKGRAAIPYQMREEFESYEYTMTDAGRYKFEAATGHDDDVSAKLLEHWEIAYEGGVREPTLIDTEATKVAQTETTSKMDSAADMMARDAVWNRA